MHLFAAGAGRGSRPGTRRPQAGHLRAPPCPSGLAAPTPLRGPGLPRAAAPPRGTLLPAGAMGDAPKHGPHRPPQSHCPKASGASMGRVIPWGTQGRGDFDSSLLFRTHRMVSHSLWGWLAAWRCLYLVLSRGTRTDLVLPRQAPATIISFSPSQTISGS